MRNVLIVIAVATVACGDDGGTGVGHDAGVVDSLSPTELVIHLGRHYTGNEADVHVLLGDGSVHHTISDGFGIARFSGVALPQDVTIVTGDATNTTALTIAGVDRNEIWLDLTDQEANSYCPCTEQYVQGSVVGTITQGLYVSATSAEFHRLGVGNFAVDLSTPATTTSTSWDLVAYDGSQGRAVSAGIRRDVVVSSGANVTGQDITLDHPFDQPFAISPENDTASGGAYRARLYFSIRGNFLFGKDTSSFPATVMSPVMDSAFDRIDREVQILSGEYDEPDWDQIDPTNRVYAYTSMPVPMTASSATVRLLTPARVTAPTVGTWTAPAAADRNALAVAWTNDAAASVIEIEVRAATQGPGDLSWTVYVPSTRGSFAFFPLPAFATPNATFPTGPHRIRLKQHTFPGTTSPTDVWAKPHEYLPDLKNHAFTTQWGMVTF